MDITRAIICISLFHVQQTQQQSRVVVFCRTTKSLPVVVVVTIRFLPTLSWCRIYNQLKRKPTIYHRLTFRSLSDHDRVCHHNRGGETFAN